MMLVINAVLLAIVLLDNSQTLRGVEAFRQGRYADARKELQAALNTDSQDQTARAFLAMTAAALHDCAAAASETDREDPALARMSGLAAAECLQASGRAPEALAIVSRLQTRFPADPDVLYESAKLHRKAWDQAIQQLFRNAPASYRVNQLSAEIFETEGKYGEAAAQWQKAIEKAPQALNLHFRYGRTLLLDSPSPENLEKAHQQFDAELKLNPSDALAEYQIGQVLTAQGKLDLGLVRFERALAIRPDLVEALLAVGKSRVKAHRFSDAIALLEKAASLQPENESAHYNLMLAYRDMGRTADALAQQKVLNQLQKPPEGEFSEFLKKLGEKAPAPPPTQ